MVTTDLISYMMREQSAAIEQERSQWCQAMQQSVEDMSAARGLDKV